MLRSVCVFFVVASCTTPNLSGELTSFSGSVGSVSSKYKTALGLDGEATIRAAETDALVADRRKLIQLTSACQGVAGRIPGQSLDDCRINRDNAEPPEISKARALNQLTYLADYVEALSLLATANTPAEIDTASATLINAVGALSGETGGGLVGLAADLKADKEAIGDSLNFAAEQYRYRRLRRIVAAADPAVARIVENLVQVAEAEGHATAAAEFAKLRAAQTKMDLAKLQGTDAAYRTAITEFYAAFDAYKKALETGVVPQIYRISTTHNALLRRLESPKDPEEVLALLKQLKDLQTAFEE